MILSPKEKTVNVINYKKYMKVMLIFIAFIMNCIRLFQKTVWADECFTIELVKKDIIGIVEGTIQDFHPPFYYLVCKLFCSCFGYSVFVFRLVSFLPILILAVCGYKWLSKHAGELAGYVFVILILLMPTSYYTIELRMYSWALLFITLFCMLIIEGICCNNYKMIIAASVFAILGAYTHYFDLLVAAFIYCYILCFAFIKKKECLKSTFISILICIITYIPWFIIVYRQMSGENAYSMGINSLAYYAKPLAGFVCILFGTLRTITQINIVEVCLTLIMAVLFMGIVVIYISNNKINSSNESVIFYTSLKMFLIIFCCVYITGCVMDSLSHKFVARYLYPLSGIIYLIFAIAISYYISHRRSFFVKSVIGCIMVIMLFDFYKTVSNEMYSDNEQKISLNYISDNISDNDTIYTDSRLYNWIVLKYYLGDDIQVKLFTDADVMNKEVKQTDGRVYYIHNCNDGSISDPGKNWTLELTSQLGENSMLLYRYNN